MSSSSCCCLLLLSIDISCNWGLKFPSLSLNTVEKKDLISLGWLLNITINLVFHCKEKEITLKNFLMREFEIISSFHAWIKVFFVVGFSTIFKAYIAHAILAKFYSSFSAEQKNGLQRLSKWSHENEGNTKIKKN